MVSLQSSVGVTLTLCLSFSFPVVSFDFYSGFQKVMEFIGGDDTDYFSGSYEDEYYPLDSSLQDRALLGERGCVKQGGKSMDFFKNYTHCGTYHMCVYPPRKAPEQLTFNCSGDQSYDESEQKCVDDPPCSKVSYPANQGKHRCDRNYDQHATDANDCQTFYVCHWTGHYYTLEFKSCRTSEGGHVFGSFFNQEITACSPIGVSGGYCPQHLRPDYGKWCPASGFHQNPNTCTQYYKCIQLGRAPKVATTTCPSGTIYNGDSENPGCIPGSCPEDEKKLPSGWACIPNGTLNLHPEDCRMYYQCHACKNSNETDEWCYDYFDICPIHQFFDEESRTCVNTRVCPQDQLELPDGWNCSMQAERNVHPQDCSKYYSCLHCNKPRGWCYELVQCPDNQYFDEVTNKCVFSRQCPQEWKELPDKDGWMCDLENDQHSVPENCSQSYICFECERPRKWCYTLHNCSAGQHFNDEEQKCQPGRCPRWPPTLPKGWNCTDEEKRNVNPKDCHKYYDCVPCPDDYPWCVVHGSCNASVGIWFNDNSKQCTNNSLNVCPQDLLPLPENKPGWQCKMELDTHVHPDDCMQRYTCVRCSKKQSPNEWCYLPEPCASGQYFDNKTEMCVNSKICPQKLTELPFGDGWNCGGENENNVIPTNCSEFYTCISCNYRPRKWCYIKYECPENYAFDKQERRCVPGRCPSYPPILPEGWNCSKVGQQSAVPTNCRAYYTCIRCPDDNPWCYVAENCPPGLYFDNFKMKCVVANRCPQDRPEVPSEPGWSCQKEEIERRVHPNDCTKFYTCFRCTKPSGWCYEAAQCSQGYYFYQDRMQCIKTPVCPQNWMELPKIPGWECGFQEEQNVVPNNCSSSYTCYQCEKPSTWCYVLETCDAGKIFDDVLDECTNDRCPYYPEVLPSGWNCTAANETNVDPNDCKSFYNCLPCPDDYPWCYNGSQKCEENKWFDDVQKKCVNSTYCPQNLIEIGEKPDWNCDHHGQLNVLPGDCSKFYKCLNCTKPKTWCYFREESCPLGSNFHQVHRKCTKGPCPQGRPEIVEGMTCKVEWERHVLPGNCSNFYICHRCNKPKKWCYDEVSCDPGNTYDEKLGQCVEGRCPQLDPLIPIDWTCEKHGEVNVVPSDCSKFFTCLACEDGPWCYNKINVCPVGQTFNTTSKQCVYGRCPQYPPVLPVGWKCKEEGERNVNPIDCSSFYTCTKCPDAFPWCMIPQKCGEGQTFDQQAKKCVNEAWCRQWPPLLPPGWNCSTEGEKSVHPEDCTKFYICHRFRGKWTYKLVSCGGGSYFDDKNDVCVQTNRCPQDPPELPPGWICTKDGEKHQHPDDCSQFYTCIRVENRKPPYWSFTLSQCPAGQNFNEETGNCQDGICPQTLPKLPPGWICKNDGELRPRPDDCNYFYKCIRVKDGWSYELTKCNVGEVFDQTKKMCLVGGTCIARLPSLPQGWKCTGDGAISVKPNDCRQYVTCVSCKGGTRDNNFGVQNGGSQGAGIGGSPPGGIIGGLRSYKSTGTGKDINKCLLGIGFDNGGGVFAIGTDAALHHRTLCGWCYRDLGTCEKDFVFDKSKGACVQDKNHVCLKSGFSGRSSYYENMEQMSMEGEYSDSDEEDELSGNSGWGGGRQNEKGGGWGWDSGSQSWDYYDRGYGRRQ